MLGDDLPTGRRSHSAFVHKDLVYVFGGYNGNEDRHFDDLWCLDPVSFVWTKLNPRGGVPSPRRISGRRAIRTPADAAAAVVDAAAAGNAGNAGNGDLPVLNLVEGENNDPAGAVDVAEGVVVGALQTHSHRAPCARRRQCCCVVKDSVILFGGTSPAVAPAVEDSEFNLMDHSDLYVLDFYPSLKTLCLISVVDHKLDTSLLPRELQWEILSMTTNSNISRPLTNG